MQPARAGAAGLPASSCGSAEGSLPKILEARNHGAGREGEASRASRLGGGARGAAQPGDVSLAADARPVRTAEPDGVRPFKALLENVVLGLTEGSW